MDGSATRFRKYESIAHRAFAQLKLGLLPSVRVGLAGALNVLVGLALASLTVGQAPDQNQAMDAPADEIRIATLIEELENNGSKLGAKEALERTGELLELLGQHPNLRSETITHIHRSWNLQCTSDYPGALAEAELAVDKAFELNDDAIIARSLYMLSVANWRLSRNQPAIEAAEDAIELNKKIGRQKELANVATLMGAIYRSQSDYWLSMTSHFAALEISQKLKDQPGIAKSRNNIGLIYWKLGRLKEAENSLRKALAIYRDQGSQRQLATCLSNIGLIQIEFKKPNKAIETLSESLEIHKQLKNAHGRAKVLSNLGFAYDEKNELDTAFEYHRLSLSVRREIGDKVGIIRSTGNVARTHQKRAEHEVALGLLEDALTMAKEINARSEQAALLELIADSNDELGNHEKALKALLESQEILSSINNPEIQIAIEELEAKVSEERHQEEVKKISQLAELNKQKLEQQRNFNAQLVIGSILLGGCCILVVALFLSRTKAMQLMKQSNLDLINTTSRLSESEERYRMLFESADVPMLLIDEQSKNIVDMNAPAKDLCGPTTEGGHRGVQQVEPRWIRQGIENLLKTGDGDKYAHDDWWAEPSGRVRWTELRGCTVMVQGKHAVLVSLRDTTESRAQELARLRADKLESLGLLAGGIAHDFNNALTAIMGYLSLAKLRGQDDIAADLDMAEAAVKQAGSLTSQLIAFSRGGEPILQVHQVDELLRGAVDLASAGSNMHIEVDVPDNLWKVELDSGQFTQVVSNLVINADHATDDTGMLEITASNFAGDPQTGKQVSGDSYVRIDFVDNGPGIDSEIRDFIFDPYFTTKSHGNGLGLTTTYAIIHRHGGEITLESGQGKGAKFSVFFPAAKHAQVEPQSRKHWEALDGGSVLILDDEPLVQNAFKQLLEHWGYEVEAVFDGQQAIETYQHRLDVGRPFDFLFMDLTVPGGLGGHEAITQILNIDPSARAVVCSGYSDNPIMANFRESGFVAALHKPFRVVDLANVIQTVMHSGDEHAERLGSEATRQPR